MVRIRCTSSNSYALQMRPYAYLAGDCKADDGDDSMVFSRLQPLAALSALSAVPRPLVGRRDLGLPHVGNYARRHLKAAGPSVVQSSLDSSTVLIPFSPTYGVLRRILSPGPLAHLLTGIYD